MYRIIVDAPGQTCNRFFSYLESISWAIINNKKVLIIFWDSSLKYYPKLRNNKYVSFPFYNRFLIWLVGEKRYGNWVFRFFSFLKKHLHNCELVNGWELRECDKFYPLVKEIANDLFTPAKKYTNEVEVLFKNIKNNENIKIIGIHFRKGDYKEWLGGKYYFEDDVYERLMTQIEQIFHGKVKFFVCTNGVIDPKIEKNHCVFRIKNPTVAHDLYALTLCDYIIGPPSTFSGWASLVGNVPLRYIHNANQSIRLDEFSPLISNSQFKNGKGIWYES